MFHDFFVTLVPSDPVRLADARNHQDRLEQFPTWTHPSDARFLMRMGENLFHLAFPTADAVREFVSAFAVAVAADATLRVWLYAADPHVAMLPWEYLCLTEAAVDECRRQGMDIQKYQPYTSLPDERTFLALHPNISLVRQANPNPPSADLERVGALRVLIVWANPNSQAWGHISGIEEEVTSILNDLRGLPASHFQVRLLAHATKNELECVMREWRPHVLHFAGHGGFPMLADPGGDMTAPSLVLEGVHTPTRRRHDYLTADELSALCAECGVQVVVLNACWGGRTSPNFTGIACALTTPAREGEAPVEPMGSAGASPSPVPVVVAHQMPILESAAVGFAAPFYQNVTLARPVEAGVSTFRTDSVNAHPDGCGVPDWGIPVVFLGVRQSALFWAERVDAYPINFGELIRGHVPIVGRQFIRDKFDAFKRDNASGVFLITAPPGAGKTAFMAQWVKDDPDAVHFFFRATAGITDPDECLKSLYHGLLGRYGILEENPTPDPIELRSKFHELLRSKVSERCARSGRVEVIVIDALDEAGTTASDGKSAVQVLPSELPPHVYLLITSRPVPLADALAREPGVTRFDLDPSSAENQRDAVAFCRRELRGRVSDADDAALGRLSERLAQQAKGNFLVLKLFLRVESLGEQVSVVELERAAEDLTGAVEATYEKFFERITHRIGDDLEKLGLLDQVLGAFVTAQAPVTREQICVAFGLRAYQWGWAFGLVSQFLERGGVRQEEGGALTYRLYHETFREFLLKKLATDFSDYHRLWADYCAGWRDLDGYARLYALRHLPTHLIEVNRR